MKTLEFEQYSPEWYSARIGIPTASSFDKIITTDGKSSKQYQKYLYQLAGERVTGKAEETFMSAAMQRGKEMEAEARQFYEVVTGESVKQVGFCVTEGKTIYGCSPDGLVGDDGGLEIKCPLMNTHIGYLVNGGLEMDYLQQLQGFLLVTGRKWVDAMSYYQGIKPKIVRVLPLANLQKSLTIELELFCDKLNDLHNQIK